MRAVVWAAPSKPNSAPPGYMTAEDIEREDAAKAAAKTKQGRKLSPYEEMLLD